MKRALIFLTLLSLTGCYEAFAQATHNGTDTSSWSSWQEIGLLTNCNDAAINSAIDCADIRTEGYNQLTLEILYTRAAGTGYEFYLETCYEGHLSTNCTTAGDWGKVAAQAVSSGTIELTPGKFTRTVSASESLTYTINIQYLRLRVADVVALGSPTSSDKITINARLGSQ